jgi:hypothetical protein
VLISASCRDLQSAGWKPANARWKRALPYPICAL